MPKFKDGAQVRLVEGTNGCSQSVLDAVALGTALYVRNTGFSEIEIVDSAGKHIALSHERRYELAEHPALTKAKKEVEYLTPLGKNLSDLGRGRLDAYTKILAAFGVEYREFEVPQPPPPPPPPKKEHRFVSIETGELV